MAATKIASFERPWRRRAKHDAVSIFTRRDFGHLEIDITIDDAKAYAKPWRAKVPAKLLPDTDLIETYCENEKDQPHKR